MKIAHFISATCLSITVSLLVSCTETVRIISSEIPESTYCTTNATFSTFYTIQGSGDYKRRKVTANGLGSIDTTDFPIRRAEVQVLDSSGNIVQCTETDSSGNYSFTIPDDGQTYTVKILSRSYNQYSKVSVLTDPTNNTPYAISGNFVADSTKTLPALVAPATDSDLRGGAFNILDQIYKANDFLLNNTSGTFDVDHKVQVYWQKGVNPVTYFDGDPDSGVSFYIPGSDKLYILGGINGDVAIEDTDHFDNSVIVHEYGHFLEDNYSTSDSQGGTHYGLYVLDPRLAWSEGFANFFSAVALGDSIYKDTYGYNNSDGSTGTGYAYYYDMENNLNASGNPQDMPTAGVLGEGGFRELAVSRFLWDAIDPHPVTSEDDDTDGSQIPFSEFWSIYTDEFKNNEPFREISLFLQKQSLAVGATDISALYPDDDKEMNETRAHYGTEDNSSTIDNATSAACKWTLQAVAKIPISGNVFERSNQFYSNDFFYYYHSGGTLSITLDYDVDSVTTADLDLYIYKDDYTYGTGEDMLTYSNKERGSGTGKENGLEAISVSAPVGHYIVNVMYYNDGAGSPATVYNLSINSNLMCK